MIDVEPLIVSELGRMLPLPDGGRADWGDVVRRAGFASRRPRLRPVLVAALIVAGIVGVGVAIAAGFGAFHGISAAQRPQTRADRIDPHLLAEINSMNTRRRGGPGRLLPASARLVKQLPDARIYAVATQDGQLCVLADRMLNNNGKFDAAAMGCGAPLTQNQPSTAGTFARTGSSPSVSWGIALNGVAAVSFMVGRHEVTVPVTKNVWAYEGPGPTRSSFIAHFENGKTEKIG